MEHFPLPPSFDRLTALRSKYVTTSRDQKVSTIIDTILTNREIAHRISQPLSRVGMIVTAGSGAGKTTTLIRGIQRHPALQPTSDDDLPAVCFKVESPVTLKALALQMLRQLGYPVNGKGTRANYWEDVRQHLMLRNTKLIWLDESQDVFAGRNARDAGEVLSTLKGLMSGPDWPVALVLSGVPDLLDQCAHDRQLLRRTFPVALEPISAAADGEALRSIIAEYCAVAGVSHTLPDDLVARLIHATGGMLGTSLELIVDALQDLLLANGHVLTIDNFVRAYQQHNDRPTPLNIFLVAGWQSISTNATQTSAAATPAAASLKSDAKRRKSIDRSQGPW
ncbi:MAG: hypothetical protein JWR51_2301 [Devosia sp.]|uniref:ATP-binding protein n=1 Tax=Devosia sp. TaxID=1871048 RepID=UPI002626AF74|nr:ATP-binding protein [Devosia sp.]MDB5529198.1 hypothetical protein [Devosia sp.]